MPPTAEKNLDIAALLDRGELGDGAYRTFDPTERPRRPAPARQTAPAPDSRSTPDEPRQDARPLVRDRYDAPAQQAPARAYVMEAAHELLSRAVSGAPDDRAAQAWGALPKRKQMTLAGVSGGVGTTTVLANVAAALADTGERVLLADGGPSLLPFYFGGRNFRSGPASFVPRHGSTAGPVHLATGPADAENDDWLLAGLTELIGDVDRVLVNADATASEEAHRWAFQSTSPVILLTPEPSSLLRLPAIIELATRTDGALRPSLLLNQFEPDNSLHAEIRSALTQRFGERLLPFVLRRDSAYSRCLASGGTVTALAPDSAAAEDIHSLVEWLRNHEAASDL